MKTFSRYFISGLLALMPFFILYQLVSLIASVVTVFVTVHVLIAFSVSIALVTLFGWLVIRVFKKRLKRKCIQIAEQDTWYGQLINIVLHLDDVSNKTKKAFNNGVLYKVDDGIYKLGFITDHDMDVLATTEFDSEASPSSDAVWVYAPGPITMIGELILVEQRKIKKLSPQSSESLPLFIFSAGLIER